MTDNELLLALSGMLDKKLKAELQPIKNELQTMKDDIADMKGEIADMKGEIADIRNEIAGMKGEIASAGHNRVLLLRHVQPLQDLRRQDGFRL